MWTAMHAHPLSNAQNTCNRCISIYRLHGMNDPNCRRINELKKPGYSSTTYVVSLTLASAYFESLLVKNKTQGNFLSSKPQCGEKS